MAGANCICKPKHNRSGGCGKVYDLEIIIKASIGSRQSIDNNSDQANECEAEEEYYDYEMDDEVEFKMDQVLVEKVFNDISSEKFCYGINLGI